MQNLPEPLDPQAVAVAEANLLPPELRKGSSRVRLIPTITLAVILGILVVQIEIPRLA